MRKLSLLMAAALALCLLVAPMAMAKEIKVGGIYDITGATSDVGKDYGTGAVAAEKYINGKGGIDGDTIKLIPNDYAYKIPEAVNLYNEVHVRRQGLRDLGLGHRRHQRPQGHGERRQGRLHVRLLRPAPQ